MRDILDGIKTFANVLDHGHIELIDVMPRLVERSADDAIVRAARKSTGGDLRDDNADRQLIRYMMRHGHTSPTEMVELKFNVKCPLFIARQWLRYRTANVNEYSGRYAQLEPCYYVPETVRKQGKTNMQASGEVMDGHWFGDDLCSMTRECFSHYEDAINDGVSREQARIILPLNTYTEFVWKIDLHNLLRFIEQRMHAGAQEEIRLYAEKIWQWIKVLAPWTAEAFEEFRLNAVTLSASEVAAIRDKSPLAGSKGEQREFQDKLERLGMA